MKASFGGGRYATDAAGYRVMLAGARRWPQRTWAIEGCQGIGRHIAGQVLADGERVVDVPPKLSARTRVFATGQGRKTDAVDARCLERRLSDIVYHQMILDHRAAQTGPRGQSGTALQFSVAGSTPAAGSSDKPLPGPAISQPKTLRP